MILPVAKHEEQILNTLATNSSLVVTAPTGSGKSTQIPKMLLRCPQVSGKILVTQPRRLAARMLGERVAEEMGEQPGQTVGYQTRFERKVSADTRILFITDGLLLRMLLSNPQLKGVGAVIFDEFHERSINCDLGLALVNNLISGRREDLKQIVMSATLDPDPLCKYLNNCPHIHAEGRTYPVDHIYLKQTSKKDVWGSAAAALQMLIQQKNEGDVLIFMPGAYEIRRTEEACRKVSIPERLNIIPLHGSLPPAQQAMVLKPSTERKVIIATNIAETSLTIPGVRHVIDAGLARVNRYDPGRGVNMLQLEPISRQSADQRAGRAGREAAGTCRRLWTITDQNGKNVQTDPEIHRIDLCEPILLLKALGFNNPDEFPWFQEPKEHALEAALEELTECGIIKKDTGELTAIGKEVARFPTHPRLAKILVEAEMLDCFDDAALIAAIISERPIFLNTGKRKPPKHDKDEFPLSDFFPQIRLLHQAAACNFAIGFCNDNRLHAGSVRQVWNSYLNFRRSANVSGAPSESGRDLRPVLIKCLLRAFPDHLACRRDQSSRICRMRNKKHAELSPQTIVTESKLLLACEIREVNHAGKRGQPQLNLVSEIREEWLQSCFPDDFEDITIPEWNDTQRRVVTAKNKSCLGVIIEKQTSHEVNLEQAAAILTDKILRKELILKKWDKAVNSWICRTRWLADAFPEKGLITYDETDITIVTNEICYGAVSYKEIKERPCLDYVKNAMSWADQEFVVQNAPEFIKLPSGRKMKISYTIGQPPKGRARIQDLYDLEETPVIAGQPVLLDILAPNMRTMQITHDLARFWKEHYPRLKKELSKRYHKHEWR